jgi:hypothetical protein
LTLFAAQDETFCEVIKNPGQVVCVVSPNPACELLSPLATFTHLNIRLAMTRKPTTRRNLKKRDQFKKDPSQFLGPYKQEIETIKIWVEKTMHQGTKQRPELIQSEKVASQSENAHMRNQLADFECSASKHSVCDSFFAFKRYTQLWN